jgi:phenylacetate-coenzyme A ligase PaaK-like adenylate-forming protein
MGGKGLNPAGYGYRSIESIIKNICTVIDASDSLEQRQKLIKEFDRDGIMATPANSSYNELVIEAARLSILNDGAEVEIKYGQDAAVAFRRH